MNPPLTRGIAGLALSAFVFLGCQDFLSEDKAAPTAKTQSEDNSRIAAAQEAPPQEATSQTSVTAESAKDMPATLPDTAKPAAGADPSTPATADNLAACKEIYAELQTAKDPLYGELKNKFGSLNCDISQVAVPPVPAVPDSATVCKNLKSALPTIDPASPKYASYQQDIAIYCTDAKAAVDPVSKPTTPAAPVASDNSGDCKAIYEQMQTALKTNEPLYLELKNKFGSLNCDITQFSTPAVPTVPDSATVCINLKSTLAMIDPASPKYASYQQEIAIYCTDAKAPATPVATPTTPAAPVTSDNTAECKAIYEQMQTAKDPFYGELKNKFGSLNCDISKFSTPFVPPDSATVCKNIKSTLAILDPSSPKYAMYQADLATYCTAKP